MKLETTDKTEKWTGKQIIILIGLWLAFLISFITRLVWGNINACCEQCNAFECGSGQ